MKCFAVSFYASYSSPEMYQRQSLTRKIGVDHGIDLSRADLETLMTLPHMTQNVALHLIHARESGHLSSLDDLRSILDQCVNCHIAQLIAEEWRGKVVFSRSAVLTVKGQYINLPAASRQTTGKSKYWGD
jgi:hypothetical protein